MLDFYPLFVVGESFRGSQHTYPLSLGLFESENNPVKTLM